MAQRGRNILIKKQIDGVYVTIAGMVTRTITVSNDNTDITTDTTGEVWRQLMGNVNSFIDISGDTVFKDDVAMKQLEQDAFEGAADNYRIEFENCDSITGMFLPLSFEYTGETLNAQKASFTLGSVSTLALGRFSRFDYSNAWAFNSVSANVEAATGYSLAGTLTMGYDASTETWLCYIYSSGLNQYQHVRSTDEGDTWEVIPNIDGANPFYMTSNGNGVFIAVITTTDCWRSTDNGDTWTQIFFSAPVAGTPIAYKYANGTWLMISAGGVVRSVDEGLTWTRTFSSGSGANCITTDGAGNWLMAGNSGWIWISQDDGVTWVLHTPIPIESWYACGYHDGVWFLAGAGSRVLRSTDPFNNVWSIAQTNITVGYSPSIWINSMEYVTGIGWFFGTLQGKYYLSADNGITFSAIADVVPNPAESTVNTELSYFGGVFFIRISGFDFIRVEGSCNGT